MTTEKYYRIRRYFHGEAQCSSTYYVKVGGQPPTVQGAVDVNGSLMAADFQPFVNEIVSLRGWDTHLCFYKVNPIGKKQFERRYGCEESRVEREAEPINRLKKRVAKVV